MNNEQPTTEAEPKTHGDLTASIERMTACLERVRTEVHRALGEVELMPRDGMKWMRLSKAVFDVHELTRMGWQKIVDPAVGTGAYFTPKSAIDFITANPPLNIPPAAEPIQPGAPKMVPGEDRRMSKPEAAYILAKLATSRRVNTGGVIALQMGVRAILKRHFDRQRNWAKRREAKAASVPTVPTVHTVPAAPHPAPLTPEEELADTIKRQKEADAL